MANSINPNLLKNFIVKTLGTDHLTQKTAQKQGVDIDKFQEANVDENDYLELDEILQDDDLFNKFAVLYTEEKDKKAEAKDKEKEKEEQVAVQEKNGAGV